MSDVCEKCGCEIKEELDSESCWCGVEIEYKEKSNESA